MTAQKIQGQPMGKASGNLCAVLTTSVPRSDKKYGTDPSPVRAGPLRKLYRMCRMYRVPKFSGS